MRKGKSRLLILVLFAAILVLTVLSITRFAYAAGPSINLPPAGTVSATFINPGSNSYWTTTLSNVPSGYDVTNGAYTGWCNDETHYITPGQIYGGVTLYSSYDPSIQTVYPGDWNRVNYVVNHPQGINDWQQVQDAIWYYIDGHIMPPSTETYAYAMVNDANANGGSFVPVHGQLLSVVVWIPNSQTTFIEVTVPTVQLTVTSAYDSPTPTSGPYTPGTGITALVTPIVAGPAGTQYVCTGWTGTGNVPATGTTTSVTFTITKDSSITWLWKTQYYLTVTSLYDSPTGQGWYDPGSTATSSVTSPTGNAHSTGWTGTGSVPPSGTATTVTFTMTQASAITWNWALGPVNAPSVGGQWTPITMQTLSPLNTLGLMAPWIALALIAAAAAVATYRRLLKKHW